MELKLRTIAALLLQTIGFNRTFMELKFLWKVLVRQLLSVLIVPLWN